MGDLPRARLTLALLALAAACSGESGGRAARVATAIAPRPAPAADAPAPAVDAPTDATARLAPAPARPRWLAIGGGSLPESNQVSIEQDLALAITRFGPDGLTLFAGGPGSRAVQVLDDDADADPLRRELAALFSPRGGRDARYRETELLVHGPATRRSTLAAIAAAIAEDGPSLLLYFAGHGERGDGPADNYVALWGQSLVTVRDLAAVLDDARRPVRLVMTTCFSGGFGELAFAAADPARGLPDAPRCGLFATTWDLEASGCDPDPDRRAQEGYGLHFLNALAGRDRDGAPVELGALDLDGDGQISPLEAHARTRVAARGFGVPTTTSERWLRQHAPAAGPERDVALPEEEAVIAALSRELGEGDEAAALAALEELEGAIATTERLLEQASAREEERYRQAAAGLLHRWPVLDDPWHPDFEDELVRGREAITRHLAEDPEVAA
ncbi:MAG: hypothetical protein R3A51_12970, partial [Nannocystaceae bacterium]